jgi:hypothetical protein
MTITQRDAQIAYDKELPEDYYPESPFPTPEEIEAVEELQSDCNDLLENIQTIESDVAWLREQYEQMLADLKRITGGRR